MSKIFISYRRDDSADVTGRMYDRLILRYGQDQVFKDVDAIPLGVDFRRFISDEVRRCAVLLAVIGRHWLEVANQAGMRRLDDPSDFVRLEIEAALQCDTPVIPLLIHGTTMPRPDQLPPSLQGLVFRNGIPVRPDPDFHRDVDRLLKSLDGWFERLKGPVSLPPAHRAQRVEKMLAGLSDANPKTRCMALRKIAVHRIAELTEVVVTLLEKDRNTEVRAAAAWTLDQLQDPKTIPALMKAIHDPWWSVRSDAGWALVHLGPVVREAVEQVLRETTNPDAREMAELILARL